MISVYALVLLVVYVLVFGFLLIDDGHRALTREITFTQWATQPGKRYRVWGLFSLTLIGPLAFLVHLLTFTP